ncbi:MAG: RidA family protein [Saprospiraceae bacterium]|nr:RidA family protein [Saprospiraceae bacterium]
MKKIINTSNAPAPVGPYNQSVLTGTTLYISGQIPINPATGEIVSDTIENETVQVLENIKNILAEAGLTMANIVKCTVFVTDMGMFSRINEVYAKYFPAENAPARELVQVVMLPKNVNIEISAIAVVF